MKLTTDRHKALHGLSAAAGLLVWSPSPASTTRWAVPFDCFNPPNPQQSI